MIEYSVWVSGIEVNDHYLPIEKATALADEYIADGWDDVFIEQHHAVVEDDEASHLDQMFRNHSSFK